MITTLDGPIVIEPTVSPPPGIGVRECGEPLVEVAGVPDVHAGPAYHRRGIAAADSRVFVRRRVLAGLRSASAALPDGIDILVWDGLRTLETQAEIVEQFRRTLPDPGDDATVEMYLALPPTDQEEFLTLPPPHTTGGAVDVTLCDSEGRELDLGAEFDEFNERSWLTHYENDPRSEYRRLRRMLYWAMLGAGFAPYSWEFWHYELGTMVSAAFHGERFAEYGAAVPWRKP
ncbi:M15 family metallopeptidase [Nonomuraea sp. NPDC049709]|uniref:M15 family metallopeptidase n=1 Tax=Nonomuraea sp. NPDC049709 TaxID=3154736 RepID=UPI0034208ADC